MHYSNRKEEEMNKITILTVMVILITFTFLAKGYSEEISCNQEIVVDTTLESDLVCDGTALRIGAGNLTLDLNGHALIGNGTDFGVKNVAGPGAGHAHVVIKNGVISNFDTGIYHYHAAQPTIKDVLIKKHGDDGIRLYNCKNAIIKDCIIDGKFKSDHGITVENDYYSTVSENFITKNDYGIRVIGSSVGTAINENVLKNNMYYDVYVEETAVNVTYRENICKESDPEDICEN